jgi:hypothetical protein
MANHTGNLRERVRPGDALVVHDPGLWAEMIRIGGFVEGQPHHWNHLVVFDHVDPVGTFWGIEGRPGGVGWRDIGHYLDDPQTLTNIEQRKTAEQRAGITACMGAMISAHAGYDWPAIAMDCLIAVNPIWGLRTDEWGSEVPGTFVCSSSYDYALEHVPAGLVSPKRDRYCAPWDFAALWIGRTWH